MANPNVNRAKAAVAAVAVAVAVGYMAVNVACNYRGAISGLFYTGRGTVLPAAIDAHTARVNDPTGYDAQYYHIIAHDPLMNQGSDRFLDNVQLRWRRIGIPALAALLSLRNDRILDYCYVAIELVFLFLGTWWLTRCSAAAGISRWSGLLFCLVPAVMVSIDRMMTDLPLAALTVGILGSRDLRSDLFSEVRPASILPALAILVLAPLVRETGLLLLVALSLWFVLHAQWARAAVVAMCSLPALAWWTWVHLAGASDPTSWLARYPFGGLVLRTLTGDKGPRTTTWLFAASSLEELALAGVWLAIFLAVYAYARSPRGLAEIGALLFVLFFSCLGIYDVWDSAYALGRTISPLLVALLIIGLREHRWMYLLPTGLMLPRLLLQYQAQLTSAWRNCVG